MCLNKYGKAVMKNRLYLVGLGNIALISALELLPSQIPISPLSAVVKKIRSPQTIGLEWPKPGISLLQRMFFFDSTFHSSGVAPLPMPFADGPRNWGQFASAPKAATVIAKIVMNFMGIFHLKTGP